jgi:hypothetical protein
LQSLPTKPKRVNAVVAECVRKLHTLIKRKNNVHIHFIPSHVIRLNEEGKPTTEPPEILNIGHSEEIDRLAKAAATEGDKIKHDPFVSSFKLHLKREESKNLKAYLSKKVTHSHFDGYPERRNFVNPPRARGRDKNNFATPLLNRTRTGHSCSRQHLYNIKMEDSNICRHCNLEPETIEHQVLHCLQFTEKLHRARAKFKSLCTSFDDALWTHPRQMNKILQQAKRKGCYI